jgi:hypothetical protein
MVMAVSVRMQPFLEKELELIARQQGITKSQFIIDAVERALGRADPHRLLLQVKAEHAVVIESDLAAAPAPRGRAQGSATSSGERVRRILKAKHAAELADWQAHHAPAVPRKRGLK